jgi:hypothetical protein
VRDASVFGSHLFLTIAIDIFAKEVDQGLAQPSSADAGASAEREGLRSILHLLESIRFQGARTRSGTIPVCRRKRDSRTACGLSSKRSSAHANWQDALILRKNT